MPMRTCGKAEWSCLHWPDLQSGCWSFFTIWTVCPISMTVVIPLWCVGCLIIINMGLTLSDQQYGIKMWRWDEISSCLGCGRSTALCGSIRFLARSAYCHLLLSLSRALVDARWVSLCPLSHRTCTVSPSPSIPKDFPPWSLPSTEAALSSAHQFPLCVPWPTGLFSARFPSSYWSVPISIGLAWQSAHPST